MCASSSAPAVVLSGAGTETHPNSAASTSADIDGVFDTGCPADVVGGQGPGGQRRDRIHGDSNDIDSYQFDSTVVQTDVDGEALSFPAVLPDDAGSAEGRGHRSESRDRGGADRTDVDGETLSSPAALPDDAGSVDGGGHKSVFHATVVFAGLVPRLLHDSLARAGFHIEERVHGEVDLGAIETQRDSEHLAVARGRTILRCGTLFYRVAGARSASTSTPCCQRCPRVAPPTVGRRPARPTQPPRREPARHPPRQTGQRHRSVLRLAVAPLDLSRRRLGAGKSAAVVPLSLWTCRRNRGRGFWVRRCRLVHGGR